MHHILNCIICFPYLVFNFKKMINNDEQIEEYKISFYTFIFKDSKELKKNEDVKRKDSVGFAIPIGQLAPLITQPLRLLSYKIWYISSLLRRVYPTNKLKRFFKSSHIFLIGIHSMQDWTATTRHGATRKRSIKRLKRTGSLFRKNLQLTGVC